MSKTRAGFKLYPALLPYLGKSHAVLICPKDRRDPGLAPLDSFDTYRPDGQRQLCSYGFNAFVHFHYPSYYPTTTFFSGSVRIVQVEQPSRVVLHYCQNWWPDYYTVGAAGWNTLYRWEFWGHGRPEQFTPGSASVVVLCDGHVERIPRSPIPELPVGVYPPGPVGGSSGEAHHNTWFAYKPWAAFYPP